MAEQEVRPYNPNFIRPGDPQRAVQNKNFVSREAVEIRSREIEATSGVAVMRPDESAAQFAIRQNQMAKVREGARVRAQMSPQIARRELAQLEQKWGERVPTAKEADRFASEFDYMNDCRVAIGWPEVDYTKPREHKESRDDTQSRFIQFKKRAERDRLALCQIAVDADLMLLVSIHDLSEPVRDAAERKHQELRARKSAS